MTPHLVGAGLMIFAFVCLYTDGYRIWHGSRMSHPLAVASMSSAAIAEYLWHIYFVFWPMALATAWLIWEWWNDDDTKKKRRKFKSWVKSHIPRPRLVVIRPIGVQT